MITYVRGRLAKLDVLLPLQAFASPPVSHLAGQVTE